MISIKTNFQIVFALSILLALFFSSSLIAQNEVNYNVLAIDPTLLEHAHDIIRYEHREITVKSKKEALLKYKKVVTILGEDSDANEVYIHYDGSSKISKLKVRIYDQLGQLSRKVSTEEIEDLAAGGGLYQDDRYKYIEVKGSSYPYTLSIEYEKPINGISFAMFPDWYLQQGSYSSVGESHFTVSVPKDIAVISKALNIDIEPTTKEDGDRKIYSWTAKNIPAIKAEGYTPRSYEMLPIVLVGLDKFSIKNYEGGMDSWDHFGKFVYQLWEGRDVLPEKEKLVAQKLTAGLTSDREKIDVLYKYLQENMRYVSVQLGIGGWQPFDARYVSMNRYGDCKALTNFMKALLQEVGVKAYPALLERAYQPSHDSKQSFVSFTFNHVILYIPSENYWLECTSKNLPPNYLGRDNMNRNAMLIKAEGGELIRTPLYDENYNIGISHTKISLNEEGAATIHNQKQEIGGYHDSYRAIVNYATEQEKRDLFMDMTNLTSLSLEELEIKASPTKPEGSAAFKAIAKKYASKVGKRLFIPVNKMNRYESVPELLKERQFPIYIASGYTERDTTIFELPEGFEIENIPKEAVAIQSDYGIYMVEIQAAEGKLFYYRTFQKKAGVFPPEAYEDFRAFFQKVVKYDKMKVVLVKKKT